ncbi:hypothetical protein ACLKA6_001148 [Drosophila palustris]
MSTQFSELQAEIHREMLGFMMEIQETVRSMRQVDPAPAKQLQEPVKTFVPPAQEAAPKYAKNWMDSRALQAQQQQQAGYREEQQNRMGPPEPSTSGNTQSCKDNGQVRRWRLTFDGSEKSMPVKEFIFRVEHMQRAYQLPWAEVIRDFHLLKQFQTRKSSFEQEQELRERRQRPGESVDEYLQEMLALRSRLDTHFSDRDLIKVSKVNIKDSISRVIYPMYITSLEMLRYECHDGEKWVANRPVGSQPPLRPFKERHQVQEVYASEPEEMPDGEPAEAVEALYRPRPGGGEKAPPKGQRGGRYVVQTVRSFESDEYLERLKVVEEHKEQFPDLRIEEGLLFKRTQFTREDREEFQWKLWIPEAIASTLVQQAHEGEGRMPGGVGKTLARLQQFYYWPRMTVQVRQYVLGCETCKETKHTTQITRPPMGKEVVTDRPMQKLYLDFLGKCILIALDHFTKFIWLRAITNATALATVKILKDEISSHFGVPEVIHPDNGKQFTSQEFGELMHHHGIKHLRTGNYLAQANASERVNQSVLAAIRTHVNEDQTTWDEKLPEIQAALRSAVHASTGVSPYFAMFGKTSPLARSEKQQIYRARIQETLHRAYEKAERSYNLKARNIKYLPGQEVYKRNFVLSDFRRNVNSKFCRKYVKCRIVRAVGNSLYELETLQGGPLGIFHAKDLKQ